MRQPVRLQSATGGRSGGPLFGGARRGAAAAGLILALVLFIAACGAAGTNTGSNTASSGTLRVVAAENFWGSIAAQLGGSKVAVTSIITNPNTDPHSYEPTAADARTFAARKMVVVDGIGYDPWATQLLAANPVSGRVVLNVGELVDVPVGGNPHRWYSPSNVHAVIDQITADYQRLDPTDAAYFAAQRTAYLSSGLARYDQLIAAIKATYAGTPVGASESIFAPLAQALGLRLLTPPTFLSSHQRGDRATAADKRRSTIRSRLI